MASVKSPALPRGHLAKFHSIEIVGDGAISGVAWVGHHIHRHHQPLPLAADDPSRAVTRVLTANADAASVGATANIVGLDRDAAINVPVIHRLPFDDRVVTVSRVEVRNHEIHDHGELVDIGPAAVGCHAVRAQVAARPDRDRRIFVAGIFHHLGHLASDVRYAKGGCGAKRCVVSHRRFAGQIPILQVRSQGRAQVTLIEIPMASHLVSGGISDSRRSHGDDSTEENRRGEPVTFGTNMFLHGFV